MVGMWDVGCGMLGIWDLGDMGCGMFGMWDVRDVVCLGCGMFGMWDVWDVGCSGCGMLGMWDVRDVGCLRCGMFEMWDGRDVGCLGYGIFAGMWDVDLQNAIRADYPNNPKRGGVCISFKVVLGVRVVNLSNLSEYIISEIFIQNSKGFIGVAYRSPSQDDIEFQSFLSNFEIILSDTTTNNALFTTILGDFNVRSSACWTNDKITTEDTKLESLTTVHGFHQLISQPRLE